MFNRLTHLLTIIGSFKRILLLVLSGLTRFTKIKTNISENFMLYYFFNTYIIIMSEMKSFF